jgi:hypothetical protein
VYATTNVTRYEFHPLEEFDDIGMVSVFDQVLAAEANNFAACTRRRPCKRCARTNSNYAAKVVSMRKSMGKSSGITWGAGVQQTPAVNRSCDSLVCG